MTRKEQKEFIKSIMENLEEDLMKSLDKIPDNWDGIELRWFIVDKANEFVLTPYKNRRSSRYREYCNDLIIKNL